MANVPKEEFEAAVESDNPPTVTGNYGEPRDA
jgi:hypothetical protein